MDIRELVGKRVLVKIEGRYGTGGNVDEMKILEVSPSGNWVKMMNMNGNRFWRPVTSVSLVEVLIDLTGSREPKPND